ncbi:MAG TPA: PLP-dependent aminotransferase family protein [Bryobacteraceae bacterium]|jgi:GntR family transcriptional regulator/MocR family aminotransferase|nr:PLP-dependent aminotransferase family protein [Bryobacteraceae bacterium]
MESAAPSGTRLAGISIDRDSSVPLYQQLESGLRSALRAATFAAGGRLPAIQELAAKLQVSRNTVRRAYQHLAADGLLEGTTRSGFCVRPGLCALGAPEEPKPETSAQPAPRSAGLASLAVEFNRCSALDQIDLERLRADGPPRPFRPAFPDSNEFPLKRWEALRAKVLKERSAELLQQCDTFGYGPLRQAIANRLRGARGVACTAEQVIISAGAQQALHLVAETLLSPGDAVGMEEPGSYRAKAAFLHAGARMLPLLVDEEGVMAPEARRLHPPAMVYVTPGSQFPLGVKLSLARRAALIEFARDTGAWIIEDDCAGEFSYSGQALASLQGEDESGRVLYLGTTGTTLFPALEIAYLVAPPSLLDRFSKTKELLGAQPCAIHQATLARFIGEGYLNEHVQRMNGLYYQRLQALAQSVDSELDEFIELEPAEAGLHAVGWLKRGVDEQAVTHCAAAAGVELPVLSNFGRTALMRPGVVFGFASFSEKQIRRAAKKLGSALRSKAVSSVARPGLLGRLMGRA